MSAAASRSDPTSRDLARIRVDGGVRLALRAGARGTTVQDLAEADGYRVRFPATGDLAEALILNTGGGIAGGDKVAFDFRVGIGAAAMLSTVTAERVYRTAGPPATLAVKLHAAEDAELHWLPQETIVFDGAALDRTIAAQVAPTARLTLLDVLVAGRIASGERLRSGRLVDHWRIHRGGRLLHAEAIRLEGAIDAQLAQAAAAGDCTVVATLLHVCADAGDHLDRVREALAHASPNLIAAASALDGRLVVRALGRRSDEVRALMGRAFIAITGRALPRAWAT